MRQAGEVTPQSENESESDTGGLGCEVSPLGCEVPYDQGNVGEKGEVGVWILYPPSNPVMG